MFSYVANIASYSASTASYIDDINGFLRLMIKNEADSVDDDMTKMFEKSLFIIQINTLKCVKIDTKVVLRVTFVTIKPIWLSKQ